MAIVESSVMTNQLQGSFSNLNVTNSFNHMIKGIGKLQQRGYLVKKDKNNRRIEEE